MSHPRSSAHSQVSSGCRLDEVRDRTKTKLADGTWRRWSVRNSNIAVMPSAPCAPSGSGWSTSATCLRPLVGGHQPTTSARASSRRPTRPRDSATLASISPPATSAAAALWRKGRPGGHSDIAGTAVDTEHDARCLVGEVLADDELVAGARGGEPGGGAPVDPVRVVTRHVWPRAGDVRSRAPARAVHRPEREPDQPPSRDEREREARADHAAPASGGSSSAATGGGASARHSSANRSIDARHSDAAAPRRASAGVNTTRWPRTGDEEPLDVAGHDVARGRRGAPSRAPRARARGSRAPRRRPTSRSSRASRGRARRSTPR